MGGTAFSTLSIMRACVFSAMLECGHTCFECTGMKP